MGEFASSECSSTAIWDPDYRCFTFGNVDMVPTIEEYGVLTEFPEDIHKVYFHQKIENTI